MNFPLMNLAAREYRPDIDGLRAVAILVVFLHHLQIAGFEGGFVGVDIFFVISGYLITRNILVEYQQGNFSFSVFYVRRIRRLFPALFFTLLVTFIGGFLILAPEHLERLGRSTIFAILSVSNVFFWSESGYFDASSKFKPLLHTWSLGVEEQFYLIWPLSLILLLKLGRRAFVTTVVLVGAGSLVFSETYTYIDDAAAFYLTPFRMYEFIIGGSLLWLTRFHVRSLFINNVIFFVGILLIIIPVVFYDNHTRFPGLSALVPCVGALLTMYSGHCRYLPRILRNRVSVYIGKISYSLYLAHWPILIYFSYYLYRPMSHQEKLLVFIVSFAAAALMYRYIETPFRNKKNGGWEISAGRLVTGLLLCTSTVIFVSLMAMENKGWEWRMPSSQINVENLYPDFTMDCRKDLVPGKCVFGKLTNNAPEVLLIGDSHADHYTDAMVDLTSRSGKSLVRSIFTGCPPLFDVEPLENRSNLENWKLDCLAKTREWKKEALKSEYKTVVLASRWAPLTEPSHYGPMRVKRHWLFVDKADRHDLVGPRDRFRESILHTIDSLVESGKRVVILGQVPNIGGDPKVCFRTARYLISDFNERCTFLEKDVMMERLYFSNSLFLEVKERYPGKVEVFVASDHLCETEGCKIGLDNAVIYENSNHINRLGSLYLARNHMKPLGEFMEKTDNRR